MKTKIIFCFFLSCVVQLGLSQGFVNLDFEASSATSFANVAIPGWTATGSVLYDTVSLGGAAVILEDTNASSLGPAPLQGTYSVLLYGASSIYAPPDEQYPASIGQAGMISTTAQSMTFWCNQSQFNGSSLIQVTFNGLPIDYLVTGGTANYTIYSADISAYAGQTGQLLFTAPVNTSALLDNIQFSTSPVPEPSMFALTALGSLLLGFGRWRKSS